MEGSGSHCRMESKAGTGLILIIKDSLCCCVEMEYGGPTLEKGGHNGRCRSDPAKR